MAASASEDTVCSTTKIYHLVGGKYAFQQGEQFSSYETLMQRMVLHTKESMVHYWRRDSRTVKNAHTKTSRPISAQLRYYSIRFACIYSDMNKASLRCRTGAIRCSTRRTDCQAYILFRASKCGNVLEVASVCNIHNHEISERMNEKLPQTRRMSTDVKEEVLEMLKLKIDRKKILEYIQMRENKVQTMKSLFNLSARLRSTELAPLEGERRIIVLQRLLRFSKEQEINAIVSKELANYDSDESTYYEVENDHLIQYISPDHEFRVNETIIESIVESRHHETPILLADSSLSGNNELNSSHTIECDEIVDEATINGDSTLFFIDGTIAATNPKNNLFMGNNRQLRDTINLLSKVDVDSNYSSVTINRPESNIIEQVHGDGGAESETAEIFTVANTNLSTSNNCSVVLYETTTDVVSNVENDKQRPESRVDKCKIVKLPHQICPNVKKKLKKTVKRISRCVKCRTDLRLVSAQLEYLRAKRNKLVEETKILQMKKKMLLKEIHRLK